MDQIISAINNPAFFYGVLGFLGLYLVVWAAVLTVWTARDVMRRTKNPVARVAIPAFVLFFGFVGFIPYVFLRPTRTLEENEADKRDLALLAEAAGKVQCPKCSKEVESDFAFCPHCEAKFNPVCECTAVLKSEWKLCPHCGKQQENKSSNKFMQPVAAEGFRNDLQDIIDRAKLKPKVKPAKIKSSKAKSKTKEPANKTASKTVTLKKLFSFKK